MRKIGIGNRLLVTGVIAAAGLTAMASGAWAQADVTGTWGGKASCNGYFLGESFNIVFAEDNLQITRSGEDLNVAAFGTLYKGKIIDEAAGGKTLVPEAGFISCGIAADPFPSFAEMGHMNFTITTTKTGTKASFKGTSVYTVGGDAGAPVVSTCTWSFKRTDTTPPNVPGCGEGNPI